MRIGEFAKKYNLTIDTIRHYMDIELLLPEKSGGHYFFGEKEEKDLKEILQLKELKFTLSEIQRIIGYSRLSQLRYKEDKIYIRGILLDKKNILDEEKRGIQKALEILKNRINEIDSIDEILEVSGVKTGIHISFIQYLSCPICDMPLELEDGKVTSNMIMEGYFRCKCGYSGNVEDGIYVSLDDEDRKKIHKESLDSTVKSAATLGEYVEGTDASLINHIYKSIDSIINFMDIDALDNKIILELGTGSGFFMRQFLSYVKPNNIYIVTDHDIDRIRFIKAYLEEHFLDCKFVFICSDLSKLPIKNESADYIVNYLTSLNYSLKNDQFLDNILIPKIKKGGKLIGCSYYVKSGSKLLKSAPPTSRKFLEERAYKTGIKDLALNNIEVKEVGVIIIESKYEVMMEGHEFHTLVYCGEK